MRIKTIIEEDFAHYKKPVFLICSAFCDFKCCKEQKVPITVCQNESWSHNKTINYSDKEIIKRYLHNPLISNICIAGLEPFEQTEEVLQLIKEFRKYTADTIIIYTGFIKEEVKKETTELCQYSNIIIKFGRYILNAEQRFDSILGITLASNNQYAEKIS